MLPSEPCFGAGPSNSEMINPMQPCFAVAGPLKRNRIPSDHVDQSRGLPAKPSNSPTPRRSRYSATSIHQGWREDVYDDA